MTYTMFMRDGEGKEVSLVELSTSEITQSTIFVCPKERYLDAVYAEILKSAFAAWGIDAIISREPMQVYQLKPFTAVSTEGAAWAMETQCTCTGGDRFGHHPRCPASPEYKARPAPARPEQE